MQQAIVCRGLFAVLLLLSIETLNARDAELASRFAAAQTAKQQCINTCRARYRDCRRLNQLSSFECRTAYMSGPGANRKTFAQTEFPLFREFYAVSFPSQSLQF